MGVQSYDLRFLLTAPGQGVRFDHTLTLGRQELMLDTVDFVRLVEAHGVSEGTRAAIEFREQCGPYVDQVLRRLGATQITVMDSSAYEGAGLLHDLNTPIPADWAGQFDVVYDGGTLEHVFNYPVALRNAMSLVKVGGHLLMQTPANNYCGHGFYQISPELLFRALAPEQGFVLERLFAVEEGPTPRWFQIADPQSVRRRVELVSSRRVVLLAQARRVDARCPLERLPQQSDYVAAWQAPPATGPVTQPSRSWLRRRIRAWSPRTAAVLWWWIALARRAIRRTRGDQRRRSFRNRAFFQPVRP